MYSAIYVIYTYLMNNSQQVLHHLMFWSTTLYLIPIFYQIWIVSIMVLLSSRYHQNLPDRLNQRYVVAVVVYKT
jgi:hypothetical protein